MRQHAGHPDRLGPGDVLAQQAGFALAIAGVAMLAAGA